MLFWILCPYSPRDAHSYQQSLFALCCFCSVLRILLCCHARTLVFLFTPTVTTFYVTSLGMATLHELLLVSICTKFMFAAAFFTLYNKSSSVTTQSPSSHSWPAKTSYLCLVTRQPSKESSLSAVTKEGLQSFFEAEHHDAKYDTVTYILC